MPTRQEIKSAWRTYHQIIRNLSMEQIQQVEQDEASDEVQDSFKMTCAHNAFIRAKKMELESEE